MSICRVAMMAYMWGDVERGQSPRQLYSDDDLRDLIHYADDLMAEGYTHEPMDNFDLLGFREWCKKELASNAVSGDSERSKELAGVSP